MTIAENLYRLRREKNISQVEAARCVGISPDSLRRYENGKRIPRRDIADRFALFYKVPPSVVTGDPAGLEVPYLKTLRLNMGLTTAQLCERLKINTKSLQQWERGSRNFGIDTAEKLAKFYKVPLSEFIEKTGAKIPENAPIPMYRNSQDSLSAYRLAKGLTMAGVGRLVGLNEEAIRRHERGDTRPTELVIQALTQIYGVARAQIEQHLKPDIRRERGKPHNHHPSIDEDLDQEPQTPVEELLRLESYEDWKAKMVGA